jgi:GWxTD domain-containing protein
LIRAKTGFAFLIAASLLLSGTAIGQAPPKLTSKQKKEKLQALPDEEQKWLSEFVQPIITPEEENLFLLLDQPYQREMFKTEFWKRRELPNLSPPYGPGYQIRYAHLRDIAATEYDGLNSDAGRMVVLQGEPAGIEEMAACGGFRQPEVWTYLSTTGSSNTVRHLFYRPSFGGRDGSGCRVTRAFSFHFNRASTMASAHGLRPVVREQPKHRAGRPRPHRAGHLGRGSAESPKALRISIEGMDSLAAPASSAIPTRRRSAQNTADGPPPRPRALRPRPRPRRRRRRR